MTQSRIVFLDYIRVFACFLVILVHASENFYGSPNPGEMAGPVSWLCNESDRLWVSLYDGFSRMSVPLFIIISAYLLAPMKETDTMWSFYRKRFLRILPPFLIFMVVYCVLPYMLGQLDGKTAMHDFLYIPLNFPSLAGHMWFLYPLISIYLFIPIISPWLRKATAKEEQFFILLFAISTCMPFLRRWFGPVWGECFWNEYHMLWYFAGYLGYLVTAHYIRVHLDWSNSKRIAIGLPMMLVGAAATILSFYVQATPQVELVTPELEIGWSFCTLNVFVLTTGAFLMFSTIGRASTKNAADVKPVHKEPAVILDLSRLSFTIYLVHILWLGYWVGIFKYDMQLATVAAIPVIAVCTFLSSWLTAYALSFVPGARWLGIEPKAKIARMTQVQVS